MAERFTVDEDVEGSSPFGHPTNNSRAKIAKGELLAFLFSFSL